jgi:hypothetical protein
MVIWKMPLAFIFPIKILLYHNFIMNALGKTVEIICLCNGIDDVIEHMKQKNLD